MPRFRFTPFQIIVHLGALAPLTLMVWDYFNGNLTVNPIAEITSRTGKTALVLLFLALVCTPISTLTHFKGIIRARRPLGLYAFFYASLHFLTFVGLDYSFDWNLIQEAILEKRYALVGFAAFLILLPLAITSTKGWQKRLAKNWKRLHRLVYLAGVLVVIHFIWLVKSDTREPLLFAGILATLLVLRLPPVRNALSQIKYRWSKRVKHPKGGSLPAREA